MITRERHSPAIAGIIALAMVIRIAFLVISGSLDAPLFNADASDYHRWGIDISNGERVNFWHRPPGYPFYIAFVYRIFGAAPAHVRISQAMLAGVCVLLIHLIAVKIGNRGIALLSSLLFAIYPQSIIYSGRLLGETLFTTTLLISVWLWLYFWVNKGFMSGFLCGLCFGMAYLVKPFAVVVLASLCLGEIIFGSKRLTTIKGMISVVVAFLMLVAAWTARNIIYFDSPALLSTSSPLGGLELYRCNNPSFDGYYTSIEPLGDKGLSPLQSELRYYKLVFDYYMSKPGALAKNIMLKLGGFFYPFEPRFDPIYATVLVISLLGMLLVIRDERYRQIFFIIAAFLAITIVYYGLARFRLPVMPYFIMLCSTAIYRLGVRYWFRAFAGLIAFFNLMLFLFSDHAKKILQTILGN